MASNDCQIVQTITPDGTLVIYVPLAFTRRSGRKRIIIPDGATFQPVIAPVAVTTLMKAFARAHRWRAMMESGDYASLTELAAAKGVTPSYLARILRLTLLAPDIVERIIGTLDTVTLGRLMAVFPDQWQMQRERLL